MMTKLLKQITIKQNLFQYFHINILRTPLQLKSLNFLSVEHKSNIYTTTCLVVFYLYFMASIDNS